MSSSTQYPPSDMGGHMKRLIRTLPPQEPVVTVMTAQGGRVTTTGAGRNRSSAETHQSASSGDGAIPYA